MIASLNLLKQLGKSSRVCMLVISILLFANTKILFGQNNTISSELKFLSKDITKLVFEANVDFEKKNYSEAITKYIEILHFKPNDETILYNLARCYANIGKPSQTADVLRLLIDGGYSNLESLINDPSWNAINKNAKFISTLEHAKKINEEKGELFYAQCTVANKYRLRYPNNFDSTKKYPLLIVLHGNGGNAESYMPFRDIMKAYGFFYVSPQGPYIKSDNNKNANAFSWFLLTKDENLWKEYDQYLADYIANIIKSVKSQFKISSVYILGHSQGGALAYLTGIRYSELIDGLVCFGARNPIEIVSKADIYNVKKKFQIFIGHGLNDPLIRYSEAREATNMLTEYGYSVTLKSFNGGHELDAKTLEDAISWIEKIELKE